MNSLKCALATLSALAILVTGPFAHAADPMIQIGGGIESSDQDRSINVLLRASVGIHGKETTGQEYVLVRLRGDVAFTVNGADRPFVDVDFVPGQYIYGRFSSQSGLIDGVSIVALPMHYARDVRLNESSRLNISLVGVSAGASHLSTSDLGLYVQFAAQFLGWKTVSHVSDMHGFGGFRWGGVGIEAGAMASLGDSLRVRLAIGGQADLTSATQQGSTFQYSNAQAYAEARVDIAQIIQLFARGSINAVITEGLQGGGGPWVMSYAQIMAGATLFF